jgi:hypothetical protein
VASLCYADDQMADRCVHDGYRPGDTILDPRADAA